jgi:hypothetical protein
MWFPPQVRSVHFGTEAFRGRIAGKAMLRRENELLGVGCLPHQPSHACDNVWTTVFERALVIAIPSHILGSV